MLTWPGDEEDVIKVTGPMMNSINRLAYDILIGDGLFG